MDSESGSLNFALPPLKLPFDLIAAGLPLLMPDVVTVKVNIWVVGDHDRNPEGGWAATATRAFKLQLRKSQEIIPVLIQNKRLNLPFPTQQQFLLALQGALDRFPLAEDGFILRPFEFWLYSRIYG